MVANPHLELDLEAYTEKNVKLIHHVANKYKNRVGPSSYQYEDFFGMATIGFIKAYNKFDPSAFLNDKGQGVSFSTYAVPLMHGEIKRYLRDDDPGPRFSRSLKDFATYLYKNDLDDFDKYTAQDIFEQSRDFLWNHTRLIELKDVTDTIYYLKNRSPHSLYEPLWESDDNTTLTLEDLTPSSSMGDYTSILVNDFLASLSEQMQKLVHLRFVKELTQREISAIVGVSQVQVSRLLDKLPALYTKYMQGPLATKKKRKKPVKPSLPKLQLIEKKETITLTNQSTKQRTAKAIRKEQLDKQIIELLENTRLGYKEIEKKVPGSSYTRISNLGRQYRSKELRKVLAAEASRAALESFHGAPVKAKGDRVLAAKMVAEGKTYAEIQEATGVPMGSLTKFKRDLIKNISEPTNNIVSDKPAEPKKESSSVQFTGTLLTPTKPNVQFTEMVVTPTKPTEEKPAFVEFTGEPKAKRKIRRTFNIETEGSDMTVAEAKAELEEILRMFESMDKDSSLSFLLKVTN